MRVLVRRQSRLPAAWLVRPQRDTISNPIIFSDVKRWVERHKLPTADTMLLNESLEELRRSAPGLTYDDALNRIEHTQDAKDHPFIDLSEMIDWTRITEEEEFKNKALEAAEVVKAALEAGLIRAKDVDLYRRPPPELSLKEKKKYEVELADYERRIKELEAKLEEARHPVPVSEEEKLIRQLDEWIHIRAVQEELTAADEQVLRTVVNRKRSLLDNEMAIDYEIAAIKKIQKEKAPPKAPGIPQTTGNATAALGFASMGMVRVKRVRIPPRIPSLCTTVESYAHLDDARREALTRKLRNPAGHYGYAFDPEERKWATIDCSQVPPDTAMDDDGLIVLPTPEKLELERGPM